MKHYKELLEMGCFTRNDVCMLLKNEDATHSLLYDYTRKARVSQQPAGFYLSAFHSLPYRPVDISIRI